MKKLFCLILLMFLGVLAFGQTTVNELANVKKPTAGKLYYSKKNSALYLFNGEWQKVTTINPNQEVTTPAVLPNESKSVPFLNEPLLNNNPSVVFPEVFAKNSLVKNYEHVGFIWTDPLFKITFIDNKSRSYRLTMGNLHNVGINIYEHPAFKLKAGLDLKIVKNNIIDVFTPGGGMAPDFLATKFATVDYVPPMPTPVIVPTPPNRVN